MKVDPATGLLIGVRQVLSPHFDARPSNAVPELIVVHGISLPPRQFGGPWIDRLFTGSLPPDAHPYFREAAAPGRRVSAHVLIRRDGQALEYVPFAARAWHAGQSEYRGRAACNDFSIGIQLEGTDDIPYTDEQYDQLARVVKGSSRVIHYCRLRISRVTATSPPVARRTRARRLTGAGSAA